MITLFRLQENVPDIYVHKSRDFQLFCRLYDSLFNGVKYSTDSLTHSTMTKDSNNTLLSLLATKIGIFTNLNLTDNELRHILDAFPYIIRYKGSKKAIVDVINVFKRMCRDETVGCMIEYDTEERIISLKFNRKSINYELLQLLLSLVVPTGYIIYIGESGDITTQDTVIADDSVSIQYKFTEWDEDTSVMTVHNRDYGYVGDTSSTVGLIPIYGEDYENILKGLDYGNE